MADLSAKTAIITGANSGIGLEAAVELARQGANVVLACRNPNKGEAAKTDIEQRAGNGTVTLMSLDLASFASIRGFAKEALDQLPRIDILLNNAGVSDVEYSPDGQLLGGGAKLRVHNLG